MKYVRKNKEDAYKFAAEKIQESIDRLNKDQIIIALPGGRNIAGVLKVIRTMDIDWEKIHIFMVDERMVPINDKDSNFLIIKNELIKHIDIPNENIHPFRIEIGVDKYTQELTNIQDYFDIVVLSSGEDAHIASLYPDHHSAKDQSEYYFTIDDSPKPPKERMTASRRLIVKSKFAILLFIGPEKRQALAYFEDKYKSFRNCPAKMIKDIQNNFVIVSQS